MRKMFMVGLLVLIFAGCTTSKRSVFLTVPPAGSAEQEQIDLAALEEKYQKYDGVYLLLENTYEHVGNKENLLQGYGVAGSWNYYHIRKEKYVLFNPDNQRLSTFRIRLGKYDVLENIYLRITYPDGQVKQYGRADLTLKTDSYGSKDFTFIYPNVRKGVIIEEGFSVTYTALNHFPPLEYDIPLQFPIPCEKVSLSFAYPDWWKIKAKKIAEKDTIPYRVRREKENRKIIITYEAEYVPAIQREPYSPFFKEVADYFEFMITQLQMLSFKFKRARTWADLMDGLRKEHMNKDGFLSTHVKKTTEEIIESKTTLADRLDTIITYLQENIEVSDPWDRRNFKAILKDKKGSLIRINGLAHSMLTKAGIDAQYLLVHSAKNGYFDKDYVNSSQFDVPAIGAIIDGERYVVFPYLKIPLGFIPEYLQGQPAVGITDKKTSKAVEFWEVPKVSRRHNTVDEYYDLTIDEDGLITVKEEKVLRGSDAFSVREKLADLNDEEIEDLMEELLTYTDGEVKLSAYEVVNREAFKKPLSITLEYSIDNLVSVLPDEVIFQTGGLFSPISGVKFKLDTEERQNPIKIYYDELFNKHIIIRFPAGRQISTPLSDVQFENIFGSIRGTYQVESGLLKVEQERLLKRSSEPKEKIGELLEITGAHSQLAIPSFVFQVKEIGAVDEQD